MKKPRHRFELNHLPVLPKDRTPRIGCIGSGFIMTDCHLVAYRKAGFNPVAVFSRDKGKAASIARRFKLSKAVTNYRAILDDPSISVVDIAVPPDVQLGIIAEAAKRPHIRGILAQKPLAMDYRGAKHVVELCRKAGKTLAVNQNMRWDHSVRAAKALLDRDLMGEAVLATIDMRAIPHWMPWQQHMGWVTLRIMSIHHLDTFRYWFGTPQHVFASVRPDPRTRFKHADGICLYILEYANGLRCAAWDDVWTGPAKEGSAGAIGIQWRIEGLKGLACGTIGWPRYPKRTPSTIRFTTIEKGPPRWHAPKWKEAWFPDAFSGPMGELLCALESNREASNSGMDNLETMALVDAAYRSVKEHRAVAIKEILK